MIDAFYEECRLIWPDIPEYKIFWPNYQAYSYFTIVCGGVKAVVGGGKVFVNGVAVEPDEFVKAVIESILDI